MNSGRNAYVNAWKNNWKNRHRNSCEVFSENIWNKPVKFFSKDFIKKLQILKYFAPLFTANRIRKAYERASETI